MAFHVERTENFDSEYTEMNNRAVSSSGDRYEYCDETALPEKRYSYRVCLSGSGGERECYGPVELAVPGQVSHFVLNQNYPNPFNPLTTVSFSVANNGLVQLSVYSISGARIAVLMQKDLSPGKYEVSWDGRDTIGRPVPSGVYLFRLEAGDFVATRKMVLLR